MRKQQDSWREQQKKGAWRQQQQKKKQQFADSRSQQDIKGKTTGNVPLIQLKPGLNQVQISKKTQKNTGGCAQAVVFVITLVFMASFLFVALWLDISL